jgi:cold shock protein
MTGAWAARSEVVSNRAGGASVVPTAIATGRASRDSSEAWPDRRQIMHGTVARLVPERGFGFIRTDDNQEYFFHRNALQATDFEDLTAGSRVEFTIKKHDKGDEPDEGPRAVSVHLSEEELAAVDHEPLPSGKTR